VQLLLLRFEGVHLPRIVGLAQRHALKLFLDGASGESFGYGLAIGSLKSYLIQESVYVKCCSHWLFLPSLFPEFRQGLKVMDVVPHLYRVLTFCVGIRIFLL